MQIALATEDRRKRRDKKKAILEDVLAWIDEDDDRAREKFRDSAAEVIEILQSIERQFESQDVPVPDTG